MRARAIREMNEISLRQLEANVALELKRISNNLRGDRTPLEITERRHRRRRAKRSRRRAHPGGRAFLPTGIPHRRKQLSRNERRAADRRLPAKRRARGMGPRHRALFSVFQGHRGKPALVAAVEISRVRKESHLGRRRRVVLVFGLIYFLSLPVAEVAAVRRGTAISAIYGTVRIEPTLGDPGPRAKRGIHSTGRSALGRPRRHWPARWRKANCWRPSQTKTTARLLKQARADLAGGDATRGASAPFRRGCSKSPKTTSAGSRN